MKNINLRTFLFILIITPGLISCNRSNGDSLPAEPVQISLSGDQVSLISSGNAFAFDLFKKVLENSGPTDNIIISPLSISCALSMALNGADGETRDAMLQTLRANGFSVGMINSSYNNLTEALLNVDKRVLITIANSVWTEKNFDVKVPFRTTLTEYYDAEARSFDITDPEAYREVNYWIEDKTNGLIREMLTGLNDNTVMLLINAIYFKGKWKSQFDKSKTEPEMFYRIDGTSSEVPMMKQKAGFPVFRGEGFTVAEFPYGQGNYVMDIILPDSKDGISNLYSLLNEDYFEDLIAGMRQTETDVTFPRFKYGYKEKLKQVLTDMGMGIAFSGLADFSNISDLDLLINDVIHQAFIETNEEGTEAAAATVVDIGVTSMPPDALELIMDHSFIYIIRETTTKSILFMGKVADPASE